MLKRKGSDASLVTDSYSFSHGLIKKKRVPWCCSDDQKGSIDCTTPATLMQSLLGDTKTEDFFKDFWEKQPLVIKRNDPNFYGTLFTSSIMKEVLQTNEFQFQMDVNVCSGKEFINEHGRLTVERVGQLISEKNAVFQFYHPQRYINELWKILEKLETYFGCLVGSNAFVNSEDSKGTAPHCDDVETFVLQIEGKVEWKLYKPMVELSRDYNQDLLEESIGEPTTKVTLEVGDMLYFPRGVIHQCETVGTGHSTYVSISTYLQNTWGDFMCHAVSRAIENALEDDVTVRAGLPINYISFLGTAKNMTKYVCTEDDKSEEKNRSNLGNQEVIEFKNNIKDYLAKLVDHIDVNMSADSMCVEFIGSRLPPYGYSHVMPLLDEKSVPAADEKSVQTGDESVAIVHKVPKINDLIRIRYPEHIRLLYSNEDEDSFDDEDDEDDSDEEMEVEDESVKLDEAKAKVLKSKVSKSKSPGKELKSKSPGKELKSKSPGKELKSKSPVKVGGKSESEDEDGDDYVEETEYIKILHSLCNDRFSHMGFNIYEELGCVKFNVRFAKALVELLDSGEFVAVNDLLLDDDDEKLLLATKLASNDLIEIKS